MDIKMKKFLFIMLAASLVTALFSCGLVSNESEKESEVSDTERSRAWKFHNDLNTSHMFITFDTVAEDGTEARFAQAISGNNVTTVIDFLDNTEANDVYELYTPELTYNLDIAGKKYSASNEPGQGNLFASFNKDVYKTADEVSEKTLDGVSYLCERFGSESTATVYYFDKESWELYAIESVVNGKSAQIMRNIKVSSVIPDNVVLSLPADFTATHLTIDTPIEWPWGD